MKKLAVLLLGVVFLSAMPCEAKSEGKDIKKSKKVYVDPQNVKITEDGVFILENDTLVPVKFVAHDENGVYVKRQKPQPPCPACGFNGGQSNSPCHCSEGCCQK